MRPTVLPAQPWSFPTPEVRTLETGLEVWLFDLPGQYVAACDLVLPTPLSEEPREIEGVATVALTAIDEGTTPHPAGRITELLELQGAAVHGAARQSSTRISLDCPVHRLPAALPLLTEVLTAPEYDGEDIARHVEWQVAAFETRLASPDAVTRQALRTALFGEDQREGRPAAGTPETLHAIEPRHVRQWHTSRFSPRGATLILAGDLTGLDIDALLAEFADWRTGSPGHHIDATARSSRVVLVDAPEAVQTTIQLGGLTVGRSSPDWAALKLAGHALVGAFSSRLNLELRERRGLTYGISGGFAARRVNGQLGMGGSFAVERAPEALARILDELTLEEAFSATEIEDARRYLIGIGPLANETAGSVAQQAATLAAVGLPAGFVNDHLRALAEPNAEAVTEAFRRHVRPASLSVAITGPARALVPGLNSAGIAVEVI